MPEPSEPAPPALEEEEPPETVYVPPRSVPAPSTTVLVEEEPLPAPVPVDEPRPPVDAVVAVPPAPPSAAHPAIVPEPAPRRPTKPVAAADHTSDSTTESPNQLPVIALVSLTALLLLAAFWPTKRSPYATPG